MNFKLYRLVIFFCVMILPLQTLHAQEEKGAEKKESGIFTLGEVVVADEGEKPVDSADSVGEEEIRQFNTERLSDTLNLLPGVTLSRTGSRYEQTVFVRGLDIKHVPIFIDGIPIYVMYDGYPDLGRFTTFDLSQVVVSKGFASVLYGPNTMGGAINMVSRKPEKSFEMSAGTGYASGEKVNAWANLGANRGNWYFQAGGSYLDLDSYPLSSDFDKTAAENGGDRENAYQTDWKTSFKVGFTPETRKDDEYALCYIHQEGEKGAPPYAGSDSATTIRYWRWPQWDKESYYFTSKTGLGETGYVKTRLYYDKYHTSLFSYDDDTYTTITKKYAFRSWYNDHTTGGSIEGGIALTDTNTLKSSFHYKEDIHKERNGGEPFRTFEDDIYSLGIEDTAEIGASLIAVTGLSYDTIQAKQAEDFNSKTREVTDFNMSDTEGVNAQAGLFYILSETGELHATVARKTRLPDMKSRYSYKMGTAIPNPDLDPEKAVNYEIGYNDQVGEKIQFKTALFCNDVKDYIQFARITDPNDAAKLINQSQNLGKVLFYGVEAEAGAKLTRALEAGLSYTFLEWDNRSNSDKLTNIPSHKFTFFAAYTLFERLTLQSDLEYAAKRYSSSDGVRKTDGFVVVNAKGVFKVTKNMTAEAGVMNIADEDYAIEEGYPEPGSLVFANLMYRY